MYQREMLTLADIDRIGLSCPVSNVAAADDKAATAAVTEGNNLRP
jgi:hypothetical protein